MIRELADNTDEGCDAECPMCGRHCMYGRCSQCGYTIMCQVQECGNVSEKILIDPDIGKFIRVCRFCKPSVMDKEYATEYLIVDGMLKPLFRWYK